MQLWRGERGVNRGAYKRRPEDLHSGNFLFVQKYKKNEKSATSEQKRKNRKFSDSALLSLCFRLFFFGFQWSDGAVFSFEAQHSPKSIPHVR